MEIQEIRKRIDEADEQLVQAFAKRMRAAADIADYKREHGLPVTPAYIRKGDFMVDCAYEQTLALCAMQEPPTAVFSSNNMTTYGCLKAFNELGLRVGADIALVGFDDIDALCWLDYNISVVSRDVSEMGKQAMRLLLQRFESERGERAGARECLPTELLLRGSELLPESGRAH